MISRPCSRLFATSSAYPGSGRSCSSGMPQIPSGGGSITALTSPCPSPRMSMKACRSSAIAIARRASILSKGGLRLTATVTPTLSRHGLADRLRRLAVDVLQQGHGDLVREGHVELAGDKAEHRRRAVRDDRVLDAVEIGQARLPVIRVAL